MKTVFKFQVPFGAEVIHDIASGFRVVHCAHQNGVPTFWAVLNPEEPTTKAAFIVVGTGTRLPDCAEHLGTYQDGDFVWHIFRLPISVLSVPSVAKAP